jgi:hypothetical protein
MTSQSLSGRENVNTSITHFGHQSHHCAKMDFIDRSTEAVFLPNFTLLVFQKFRSGYEITLVPIKEVQIVYRLFLVNCYLLHVSRLSSQPASNAGGWVSDFIWLELAWQYIAMTRNNLSIIWISLVPISISIQNQLLSPKLLISDTRAIIAPRWILSIDPLKRFFCQISLC